MLSKANKFLKKNTNKKSYLVQLDIKILHILIYLVIYIIYTININVKNATVELCHFFIYIPNITLISHLSLKTISPCLSISLII